MTEPLLARSILIRVDEMFDKGEYGKITDFVIKNTKKIDEKIRTRIVVDFLMLAYGQSDSEYGVVNLVEAKKFYDNALFIRKSGVTATSQGDVNVSKLLQEISMRLMGTKVESKASCCRCM